MPLKGTHTQRQAFGRLPTFRHLPVFQRGPRALIAAQAAQAAPVRPWQRLPADWTGSAPEFAVDWALRQLGYLRGLDYEYQGSFLGGHRLKGGVVPDFVVYAPQIIIQVQGEYVHYEKGARQQADDQAARQLYGQYGYTAIGIDAEPALRDPVALVKDALNGIDRSQTGPLGLRGV